MKHIKHSILKKDKGLSSKRRVMLKNVAEIKSVLLVTDDDHQDLKKKVEEVFSSASVYHLFSRANKEDETSGFYYAVHSSDFNLTGKVKNDKLRNLEEMKLDLLIDLSKKSVLLEYFVKRTDALLKIGSWGNLSKSEFYDLIVEEESNKEKQIETIVTQLKILTTNGTEAV